MEFRLLDAVEVKQQLARVSINASSNRREWVLYDLLI